MHCAKDIKRQPRGGNKEETIEMGCSSIKILVLLFYICAAVNGNCDNGTTKRLVRDQLKALEKSVNTVVDDGSCCKPISLHVKATVTNSDQSRKSQVEYKTRDGQTWVPAHTKELKTPAAFHAEIRSHNRFFKGGSVWVYDKVVTNVGNAYNSVTGKFTTPRKGVYQFNWYTLSDPGKMSHAGLYVNGKIKGRQASNNGGGGGKWITAGSNIVLALEKGDSVYIMDVYGWESTVRGSWTTFGGVQLS